MAEESRRGNAHVSRVSKSWGQGIQVAINGLSDVMNEQDAANLRDALCDIIGPPNHKRYACHGLTARWCPVHGDCTCPDWPAGLDRPDCPLHSPESTHAERAERPDGLNEAEQDWRAIGGRVGHYDGPAESGRYDGVWPPPRIVGEREGGTDG